MIQPPNDSLVALLAWLAGTAGALTTLAAIGHYVRQLCWWGRATSRRIERLVELSDGNSQLLNRELTPNGGGSMKDKLDEQCTVTRALLASSREHIDNDDAIQGVLLSEQAAIREEQAAIREEQRALLSKVDDMWRRILGLSRPS